jgi:hypothetical protein
MALLTLRLLLDNALFVLLPFLVDGRVILHDIYSLLLILLSPTLTLRTLLLIFCFPTFLIDKLNAISFDRGVDECHFQRGSAIFSHKKWSLTQVRLNYECDRSFEKNAKNIFQKMKTIYQPLREIEYK